MDTGYFIRRYVSIGQWMVIVVSGWSIDPNSGLVRPLQLSTLVSVYSIGLSAISNQDCLEGVLSTEKRIGV